MFDKIAIIGLGLIGSSIAHAARRGKLAKEIAGFDASADVRARAAKIGFCDSIPDSIAAAVKDAQLVILCTPVGAYQGVAQAIAPYLAKDAILSDVGSVKGAVVRDVVPSVPAGVHFIPAHPIAGTEFSGPEAGFATLFDGRWAIITPLPDADGAAVARLRAFWEGLGSRVDAMDPAHHDLVLAITSHLPHLIAYNIVGTAHDLEAVTEGEVIKYSASGFRDFTRIAASDPTVWRDILLANREELLKQTKQFRQALDAMEYVMGSGNADALEQLIRAASTARGGWTMNTGKTPPR